MNLPPPFSCRAPVDPAITIRRRAAWLALGAIVPLAVALCLAVVARAEDGVAAFFKVVPGSGADQAALDLRDEGGTLVVGVRSSRGIGRMTLERKTAEGAAWPERVVLEITGADGRPLEELEGLILETSSLRVEGSRRTSGRMECRERATGEDDPGRSGAQLPAADVRVEKSEHSMRITIPGKVLGSAPAITIQWIDYYR